MCFHIFFASRFIYLFYFSFQKVRYRMFDNVTHFDSVIRTCSDQPCLNSSLSDFEKCLHVTKDSFQYMITGCTLRSCCSDKDLCNNSSSVSTNNVFIVIPTVLSILCIRILANKSHSWPQKKFKTCNSYGASNTNKSFTCAMKVFTCVTIFMIQSYHLQTTIKFPHCFNFCTFLPLIVRLYKSKHRMNINSSWRLV